LVVTQPGCDIGQAPLKLNAPLLTWIEVTDALDAAYVKGSAFTTIAGTCPKSNKIRRENRVKGTQFRKLETFMASTSSARCKFVNPFLVSARDVKRSAPFGRRLRLAAFGADASAVQNARGVFDVGYIRDQALGVVSASNVNKTDRTEQVGERLLIIHPFVRVEILPSFVDSQYKIVS